jgi:hypothetical protein
MAKLGYLYIKLNSAMNSPATCKEILQVLAA